MESKYKVGIIGAALTAAIFSNQTGALSNLFSSHSNIDDVGIMLGKATAEAEQSVYDIWANGLCIGKSGIQACKKVESTPKYTQEDIKREAEVWDAINKNFEDSLKRRSPSNTKPVGIKLEVVIS